jgi:hypothetical protein
MRIALVYIVISLLTIYPANALIVSNGDTVYVSGPFTPDPLGPVAILTATLIVDSSSSGYFPYPLVQAGFHAGAEVYGIQLNDCGFNVPGPCYPYGPTQAMFGVFSPTAISISTFFSGEIFDPYGILLNYATDRCCERRLIVLLLRPSLYLRLKRGAALLRPKQKAPQKRGAEPLRHSLVALVNRDHRRAADERSLAPPAHPSLSLIVLLVG